MPLESDSLQFRLKPSYDQSEPLNIIRSGLGRLVCSEAALSARINSCREVLTRRSQKFVKDSEYYSALVAIW